jgi:peptidoglycan/LPS O-acetylase OafA/YrhL
MIASGKKILSLQGLRAVACVMIFLCHSHLVWEPWGGWAVSVFFVMSGFLMYRSYAQRNLPESIKDSAIFAWRKVKKLYPLHILMLFAAMGIDLLLILTGKTDESIVHMLLRAVPNIFLIQSWLPVERVFYGFNGVSWFLSSYVSMIFLFPFLMRKMQKSWSKKKAIILTVGCYFSLLVISFLFELFNLQDYEVWFFYIFPPTRLLDFIVGMQASYLLYNRKGTLRQSIVTAAELAIFALIVLSVYVLTDIRQLGILQGVLSRDVLIFMPTSVVIVCLISFGCGLFGRLFSTTAFNYIGDMSMYVFLIHNVMLKYAHILLGYFADPVSPWLLMICGVLVTAAAVYIYKMIERSIIKKLLK